LRPQAVRAAIQPNQRLSRTLFSVGVLRSIWPIAAARVALSVQLRSGSCTIRRNRPETKAATRRTPLAERHGLLVAGYRLLGSRDQSNGPGPMGKDAAHLALGKLQRVVVGSFATLLKRAGHGDSSNRRPTTARFIIFMDRLMVGIPGRLVQDGSSLGGNRSPEAFLQQNQ